MGGLVLRGLAFLAAAPPNPRQLREEEMHFLVAEAQPEVVGPQVPGPAASLLQRDKMPGM